MFLEGEIAQIILAIKLTRPGFTIRATSLYKEIMEHPSMHRYTHKTQRYNAWKYEIHNE